MHKIVLENKRNDDTLTGSLEGSGYAYNYVHANKIPHRDIDIIEIDIEEDTTVSDSFLKGVIRMLEHIEKHKGSDEELQKRIDSIREGMELEYDQKYEDFLESLKG